MPPRPSLERLSLRPTPESWGDDELVSLAEAVALFFPKGPLTASSLRVARRRGELACVEVCGRTFTTPRAMRTMSALTVGVAPEGAPVTGSLDADRARAREALRRRLAAR